MRYYWYSIYAPRFALRLTELFKRRWLVHSKSFESQGVNMVQNARSSQTMANSTQGYYGKNIFRTLKTKLRLAWEGWVSPVFLDPRIAQWRTSALDLLRLSSLIECSNQDLLHMEPITESPMRPILHVRIILKAVDIFGRCLRRTLKDCCPTASGLSWLLQQNSRELETLKLGQRPYAVLGNAFEKSCKGLDLGFPKLFRK